MFKTKKKDYIMYKTNMTEKYLKWYKEKIYFSLNNILNILNVC